MDIPPLKVEPAVPIQPLGAQPQAGNFDGRQAATGEDAGIWLFLVQAILTKALPFKRPNDFFVQHRIRAQGKKPQQPLAVALKQDGLSGKVPRETCPNVKAQEGGHLLPKVTRTGLEKGEKAEKTPSEAKLDKASEEVRYASLSHKMSFKEVRERIQDLFIRRDPNSNSRLEKQPFTDQTNSSQDKLLKPTERAEFINKERPEDKERLALERAKERARVKDDLREQSQEKVVIREQPITPIHHMDRMHPGLFLGLGNLQGVAQNLASNPEFCSAKSVIIVYGMVEKAFLSHLLRQFGSFHKQVYIWTLGVDEPYGAAWSFLQRLGMPYVTLFHLDLGRKNAGWNRVKHSLRTLLALMGTKIEQLSEEVIAALPHWDDSTVGLETWLELLESHGIFFTTPMDFDFMLLRAYSDAYMTKEALMEWSQIMDISPQQAGYSRDDIAAFGAYYRLFYQDNRLLVHQQAWRLISPLDLIKSMPVVIQRLLSRLARS